MANHNLRFFIVGSNVNRFNFHSGWYLATFITSLEEYCNRYYCLKTLDTLKKRYNEFNFYLDPELGRYPVYYVEIIEK